MYYKNKLDFYFEQYGTKIVVKTTVKVATVNDKGILTLIVGEKRIEAKMIGTDFTTMMPDAVYSLDQDLSGKYVDISFDENKVSNGYAMIYIYSENASLYNAKLLKEGKIILDSSISKKALEYLAKISIEAYLNMSGVFSNYEESEIEVAKYKIETNNILSFINDEDFINPFMEENAVRYASMVYEYYKKYWDI